VWLCSSSPSGGPLLVFAHADQQARVAEILIGRHQQVDRRRNILEYATGEIELRAVTRAEEPARPVGSEAGGRTGRQALRRRAAEMRADADEDQNLRLDRAPVVLGVLRLLRFDGGMRIGQQI